MRVFKGLLTPVSILVLSGVIAYDRVAPRLIQASAPAINGVALGRTYAPALASAYGDAWIAAARAIDDGKTVAEAQTVLQETWKEARIKSFRSKVLPTFSIVLPEGTEPANPAKRAEVANLWRAFAKGLKQGL